MGPKKVKDEPGPSMNYLEIQDEEVQAIEAIYGDDFEAVQIKSAWSKSERSFRLKIRPTLDDQSKSQIPPRSTNSHTAKIRIRSSVEAEKRRMKHLARSRFSKLALFIMSSSRAQ
jgi:hypothetical protein